MRKSQTTAWRRAKREQQLQKTEQYTYKLSSEEWREISGTTVSSKKTKKWREKYEYDSNDTEATGFSGKSLELDDFKLYLQFTTKTWNKKWDEQKQSFLRKQRIYRLQQKQRALYKVARSLTNNRDRCVIVWGKGSVNAPIIRGSPTAPNKYIYSFLARIGHTVILSSEYRTSQDSPCCVEQVSHPRLRKKNLPHCSYCDKHETASSTQQPADSGYLEASSSQQPAVCRHQAPGTGHLPPLPGSRDQVPDTRQHATNNMDSESPPHRSSCSNCNKRRRPFSRVSCCPKKRCKKMWDRDLAAAIRIKSKFWEKVLLKKTQPGVYMHSKQAFGCCSVHLYLPFLRTICVLYADITSPHNQQIVHGPNTKLITATLKKTTTGNCGWGGVGFVPVEEC